MHVMGGVGPWYGAFETYHLRIVMVMGVEIDPALARLQRQHTGGVLPAALVVFSFVEWKWKWIEMYSTYVP